MKLSLCLRKYIKRILPFKKSKVFVLAVPHFDWKLVNLMIEEGYFRSLKKIMEECVYGSVFVEGEEVNTPVEFTSMITGVRRSKHGIGYGPSTDKEYVKDGRMISRNDIKSATIWEIVERFGLRVGIYNWVLSWPPIKVDGFMITGRLSQDENISYPPQLKERVCELNKEFDKEGVTDHYHNRFHPRTAIELIEEFKPDLFLGMYEAAHGRDHMLWAWVEPEEAGIKSKNEIRKYRKRLFGLYEPLDTFFKEALEKWPEVILMILSESGMRVRDEIIYSTGGGFTEMFEKLNLGLKLYAYDLYPPHLPKAKPELYIPQKTAPEKEKMIDTLRKIKVRKVNVRFFKELKWDGDWFSFSFNFHPKWLRDSDNPYIEVILPSGEIHRIWITRQTGAGTHTKGGVFIVKGPGIRKGHKIEQKIHSIDIAPTILWLLKCPVPNYMEGEILTEICE